jgi:hypothetical protein
MNSLKGEREIVHARVLHVIQRVIDCQWQIVMMHQGRMKQELNSDFKVF